MWCSKSLRFHFPLHLPGQSIEHNGSDVSLLSNNNSSGGGVVLGAGSDYEDMFYEAMSLWRLDATQISDLNKRLDDSKHVHDKVSRSLFCSYLVQVPLNG